MIRFLTIIFFFLFTSFLFSQEKDSIALSFEKRIKEAITPAEKTRQLYIAGKYYLNNDLRKSENFLLKAKHSATDPNARIYRQTLTKLGILERRKGNYGQSLIYLTETKKIYERINDSLNLFSIYSQIGNIYKYLNELPKAKGNYLHAFEIAKKLNKQELIAESNHSIGIYFLNLHNSLSSTIYNSKLDSSLFHFNKSLKLYKDLGLTKKVNRTKKNLATAYSEYGNYEKAIQLRNQILPSYKKNSNQLLLSSIYYNNGISYKSLKKPNISIAYLDSTITISKQEGYKHRIAKSHLLKAAVLAEKNDYKNAYNNHLLYKIYADSIFHIDMQKKIKTIELQNEFNIERKELEILKNKEENKKKNYITLLVTSLLIALITFYAIWKNSTTKNKIAKEKLQTEELKKEILAQKVKNSESELKSLIADNTMRLEFIKQLSKQIKEDKNISDSPIIKKYTNSLFLKLQQQITTENKSSALQDKIININQGFDEKVILLFPNLTKTEREVCSFLRLNLSIKEIALIRNVSTDSIKAVRYRIRKKLKIPKGQELDIFIQTIAI